MWFKKLSNFANLVNPVYLPTFVLLATASDNNETCDIVKIQEVQQNPGNQGHADQHNSN